MSPHQIELINPRERRTLQQWYRRGYRDATVGRPSALSASLTDERRVAYLTGRADGAVARVRGGAVLLRPDHAER
jgi:hypothetical protein